MTLRLIKTKSGAELEPLQVTLHEAARMLSISYRQLCREIAEGRLPAIGRGRLRRVSVADLRAWQDRNRTNDREAA